jgi:hypothetical protein
MITPTVGRIVWFRPVGERDAHYAAIVTHVLSDTSVDLVVFGYDDAACLLGNVELVQGDTAPSDRDYCEWMPYQKGQAAKTEMLEAKLGETP